MMEKMAVSDALELIACQMFMIGIYRNMQVCVCAVCTYHLWCFNSENKSVFIVCSALPRLTLAAQHLLRVRAVIVRRQLALAGQDNQTWQQNIFHIDG